MYSNIDDIKQLLENRNEMALYKLDSCNCWNSNCLDRVVRTCWKCQNSLFVSSLGYKHKAFPWVSCFSLAFPTHSFVSYLQVTSRALFYIPNLGTSSFISPSILGLPHPFLRSQQTQTQFWARDDTWVNRRLQKTDDPPVTYRRINVTLSNYQAISLIQLFVQSTHTSDILGCDTWIPCSSMLTSIPQPTQRPMPWT